MEATNNSDANLLVAVDYAAKHSSVVSMSWGGGEFSQETTAAYDGHFSAPGVVFVASSGDDGAPASWPAVAPNVLAVGGTKLVLDGSNAWSSESAWTGSGGGPSQYEAKPSYQTGVVTQTTMRGSPDVAYDGDPNTGFAVYNTFNSQGWIQVGGTSAGSSAVGRARDRQPGRVLSSQPLLNKHGASEGRHLATRPPPPRRFDITTGQSTGNPNYSAIAGYDFATGIGSPRADLVVQTLASGFEYNTQGHLDPTFGAGGKATVSFGGDDTAGGMAIQPDGKYVVAGGTTAGGDAVLTRFNVDGTLDTNFGTLGKVLTDVPSYVLRFNAVAIQPDGKIVSVGNIEASGTTHYSFLIARYLRNGTPDASFRPGGKVTVNFEQLRRGGSVDRHRADGKIIVAGYANTSAPDGFDDFALLRLNASGSLDEHRR